MNNLRAALTLSFVDQLTPGLKTLTNGLNEVFKIGRNASFDGFTNMSAALRGASNDASLLSRSLSTAISMADRAASALTRAGHAARNWASHTFGAQSRIGAFGAAAGGYSLKLPLDANAEYSDMLRTSAITAGKYGPNADAFMATLRARFNQQALATGQSNRGLAGLNAWMLYNGFSPDIAEAQLPGMARIATAYGADVTDVARVGEAVGFSLKVKPEEINRALAVLALLGKEGGFQFPDMTRVIPDLASAAAGASMTGMGAVQDIAAAMQIVLKGVSDRDPAKAGTQLRDFLMKITSEPTRKVFEGYGVDILGVIDHGLLQGQSPMISALAMIQKIQKDTARRKRITNPILRRTSDDRIVASLFGEMDSQAAARILLQNAGELKRLIQVAKEVDLSMVDKDFAERMRDDKQAMNRFYETTKQAGDRLGKAFTPLVRNANDGLDRMREYLSGIDKEFPSLIDNTLWSAGALAAFGVVLGVLGVVGPQVAAGFGMIAGVVGALFTPVGATLALIAGGAYYIMSNWDRVGPHFSDIWEGTKGIFLGVVKWINSTLMLDHVAARNALIDVWVSGKTLFGAAISAWKEIFTDLTRTLDGWTGGTVTATFNVIAKAIGDAAGKIEEFMKWFRELTGIGEEGGQGGGPLRHRHPRGQQPWNNVPIPQSYSPEDGGGIGGTTTIYIRAEPGTAVTRTEGGARGVSVDPGLVTGRA